MHALITALKTDHVNINKLLIILGKELEKFSSDQDADLYLMLDIIDYVEKYPDLIHHPREDLIFDAFTKKMGEKNPNIETLSIQHQSLPTLTHSIRQVIENIIEEAYMMPRSEVSEKIQDYIDRQRQHLRMEEATVFPLIDSTLDEDDWKQVEENLPYHEDPLFGNHLEERYKNLFKFLIETGEQ